MGILTKIFGGASAATSGTSTTSSTSATSATAAPVTPGAATSATSSANSTLASATSILSSLSSSTNSSTSSSTSSTTSSTAPNPVQEALDSLLKQDNVEKLWKEQITDSNILYRIIGIFVYLFKKGDAEKQDATAIQVRNQSHLVAKLVGERFLTSEEAQKLGASAVAFNDPAKQNEYAAMKLLTENALDDFYKTFKTRVSQLGINENDAKFGIISTAAIELLKSDGKQIGRSLFGLSELNNKYSSILLEKKMETTVESFNSRIFDDMINGLASQPLDKITSDTFKAKTVMICKFFNKANIVEVEARIRQAIVAKHNGAFEALIQALTNATPTDACFVERKDALKTDLIKEKVKLEAKRTELCGTDGFNGTINAATLKLQEKLAAMNAAEAALTVSLNAISSGATGAGDRAAKLAFVLNLLAANSAATNGATLGGGVTIETLRTQATTLQTAIAAYEAAEIELKKLTDELGAMGLTVGPGLYGRQNDVIAALEEPALEQEVKAQLTKAVDYYNQLKLNVDDANKQQRYTDLHRVIGAYKDVNGQFEV